MTTDPQPDPSSDLLLGFGPQRDCTQGHRLGGSDSWLRVGDAVFCMRCIEEKVPGLLDHFGIGRVKERGP